MEPDQILKKLETDFNKVKKELKIKQSLDELDNLFSVREIVLDKGRVPLDLGRSLASIAVNFYMGWYNYLNGLIMPNPGFIASMNESSIFSEEDKDKIHILMSKLMALSSLNGRITTSKDKKLAAEVIDRAIALWPEFSKEVDELLQRVNAMWEKRSKDQPQKKRPQSHYG
ncbi:hypothetical protein COV18_06385 [Candidatus Woesearchaeota archaeon CG10_big_fil_rev_8_21_14_0_10_37_12]|nr:MAG: hypothetical protein COV18_06385 [Candidatus Woesearchaeota archaeon CG10_big_fil_rev_8_21_14_0_10_37_12]